METVVQITKYTSTSKTQITMIVALKAGLEKTSFLEKVFRFLVFFRF